MNHRQRRALFLQVTPPLAERLNEIGPFTVEVECAPQNWLSEVHGIVPGCYSRKFTWRTPAVLAAAPVPFDLIWNVILSRSQPANRPADLDPDDQLFAMWHKYAPTHSQRIGEFEQLLAEQHRLWFGQELPSGATSREDLWYTVQSASVSFTKNTWHSGVEHDMWVKFDTEWFCWGDTPSFRWNDRTGQFIPPEPEEIE